MSVKVLSFAAGLFFAASAALAQTAPTNNGVQIKDVWARATPGGAEIGAAYATIVSPVADHLTAISTPVAAKAQLHTMTMDGGIMKMRPLANGVDLPAGQPVTLKPGGMHVMLIGLKQPLKAGESFPMTLTFEKGGSRQVTVAIEKPGAMGPQGTSGSAPGASPGGTGTMPPGTMPPGTMPPGTMPPGTMPPGTMPPGTMPPGTMPTKH